MKKSGGGGVDRINRIYRIFLATDNTDWHGFTPTPHRLWPPTALLAQLVAGQGGPIHTGIIFSMLSDKSGGLPGFPAFPFSVNGETLGRP